MAESSESLTSTKPYLVRAIHEWILDNGLTPHLIVDATYPSTRVPPEHVSDGRIVLNLSPSAVHRLVIGNEIITFSARFGGVSRNLAIPSDAVIGIVARENGEGLVFPPPEHPEATTAEPASTPAEPDSAGSGKPSRRPGAPSLKIVK